MNKEMMTVNFKGQWEDMFFPTDQTFEGKDLMMVVADEFSKCKDFGKMSVALLRQHGWNTLVCDGSTIILQHQKGPFTREILMETIADLGALSTNISYDEETEYAAICKTGLTIPMLKAFARKRGYKKLRCLAVQTRANGICNMEFTL